MERSVFLKEFGIIKTKIYHKRLVVKTKSTH